MTKYGILECNWFFVVYTFTTSTTNTQIMHFTIPEMFVRFQAVKKLFHNLKVKKLFHNLKGVKITYSTMKSCSRSTLKHFFFAINSNTMALPK